MTSCHRGYDTFGNFKQKSPVQSEGQDVHRDMKSLANDVPARFSVKLET